MKLKALVLSDHESEYIWDFFDAKAFAGVDVMISCGDLKPEYLSFLVTMIPAPLLGEIPWLAENPENAATGKYINLALL
mgnify:CR=1 FL=1